MRRMLLAFALSGGLGFAACAGDDANVSPDPAVAETTATAPSNGAGPTAPAATGPQGDEAQGDFGSRYIGSPVAFWFWAPY